MSEINFKRVLVVGAMQVGKSSIVSAGLCNDFTNSYAPTTCLETFADCERRVEYIDMPGLAEEILFGISDGTFTDDGFDELSSDGAVVDDKKMRKKFNDFNTDPIVREILGAEKSGEAEDPIIFINDKMFETFDAYLIVWNDNRSLRIARALFYALEEKQRERERESKQSSAQAKGVYVVKNEGTISRKKKSFMPAMSDKNREESTKVKIQSLKWIFRDKQLTGEDKKLTPQTNWENSTLTDVNASTRDGLNVMFDELQKKLFDDSAGMVRFEVPDPTHVKLRKQMGGGTGVPRRRRHRGK